ncbi:MAG: hypothetical protein NWT00_03610, partial [Beijerinckiaceae bacterium]|nr:hypothetical protein [Beijerinckiaceae bacterium]
RARLLHVLINQERKMGIISDTELAGAARRAILECVKSTGNPARPYSAIQPFMPGKEAAKDGPWKRDTGREISRIGKALREERRLGQSGHWSYDLNRHLALVQALAACKQELQNEVWQE